MERRASSPAELRPRPNTVVSFDFFTGKRDGPACVAFDCGPKALVLDTSLGAGYLHCISDLPIDLQVVPNGIRKLCP